MTRPLYFVTFNTHARRHLLTKPRVHQQFIAVATTAEQRGVAVGRYVLMPDHAHLFVRSGPDFLLPQWMRMLKRTLSKSIAAGLPHWQHGFFDHLLRHSESYAQKWEYVRQNPVRAGLIADPDHWPYTGEIVHLPR
ncbi:MAG TPA: transposase [Chthoniobacterales bacterium]|nr:transposase [Chthoniobacterales bacterium]